MAVFLRKKGVVVEDEKPAPRIRTSRIFGRRTMTEGPVAPCGGMIVIGSGNEAEIRVGRTATDRRWAGIGMVVAAAAAAAAAAIRIETMPDFSSSNAAMAVATRIVGTDLAIGTLTADLRCGTIETEKGLLLFISMGDKIEFHAEFARLIGRLFYSVLILTIDWLS